MYQDENINPSAIWKLDITQKSEVYFLALNITGEYKGILLVNTNYYSAYH